MIHFLTSGFPPPQHKHIYSIASNSQHCTRAERYWFCGPSYHVKQAILCECKKKERQMMSKIICHFLGSIPYGDAGLLKNQKKSPLALAPKFGWIFYQRIELVWNPTKKSPEGTLTPSTLPAQRFSSIMIRPPFTLSYCVQRLSACQSLLLGIYQWLRTV